MSNYYSKIDWSYYNLFFKMKRFAKDQDMGKQITRSLLDAEDCAYSGGGTDVTTFRTKFARKTFGLFSVQVLALMISLTLVTNGIISYTFASKQITITCFVLGFLTTIAA